MAKYVKTDYVPEHCDYLTAGKEYKFLASDGHGGFIVDDNGKDRYIKQSSSGEILGRDWTVINR